MSEKRDEENCGKDCGCEINPMRYTLALYCSDLTDSTKDFIPVGVLVVDENAQKYAFRHLLHLPTHQNRDRITKAIWRVFPALLEQRFHEYTQNPNHDLYKKSTGEYHGFISQIISEWSQSSICFSDSTPLEGDEDIEQRTRKLFKEKVLRSLD